MKKIFIAMLFLPILACHKSEKSDKLTKGYEKIDSLPPLNLSVKKIETKKFHRELSLLGVVAAKTSADLSAKLSGKIMRMNFELGDRVSASKLLVEIDAPEIKARLAKAKTAFKQAELDFKRAKNLLAKQAITRSEFDDRETGLNLARASLREAEAMLANAKIHAPFAGVVSSKFLSVGDLAMPGEPLLRLEGDGGKRVHFQLPQNYAKQIKMDDEIKIASNSGNIGSAKIVEIAGSFGQGSGSALTKANIKDGGKAFDNGQNVRVLLPYAEAKGIFVPANALVERGNLTYVFVVKTDANKLRRAHLRLIKTENEFELGKTETLLILSGLEPGEQIVTNPPVNLLDGRKLN